MLSLKTFYLSALVFLTFSMCLASSQQRRLLSMVGVLLQLAFLLLLLHFEYTAFIVVVVYVGAIAVLFLFVIMLVSLSRPISAGRYALAEAVLPWALVGAVGLGLTAFWYAETGAWAETWTAVLAETGGGRLPPFVLPKHSLPLLPARLLDPAGGGPLFAVPYSPTARLPAPEIEQLGAFLWTEGSVLVVLGGLVLLIAVVGSVALLRGVLRSNLRKRARLLGSSTTNFVPAVLTSPCPSVARWALHAAPARRLFCSSRCSSSLKNPLPGVGLDRILGPAAELLIFVSYRRTYRFYYRRCREATRHLPQTTRYLFEYLLGYNPVSSPTSVVAWPRQYLAFVAVWLIFFAGVLYHAPLGVVCLWARRTWRYWAFETDPDFWGGVAYLYRTLVCRQYRYLRRRYGPRPRP